LNDLNVLNGLNQPAESRGLTTETIFSIPLLCRLR